MTRIRLRGFDPVPSLPTPPVDLSGLGTWLEADDPLRRAAAAHALGSVQAPGVTPALLAHIDDPDRRVRRECLSSLAGSNDRSAVPALLARLADPLARSRPGIARTLGLLGDPAALPALRSLVKDPDKHLRDEAHAAICLLGEPCAVPYDPAFALRVRHRLARPRGSPELYDFEARVLLPAALEYGGAVAAGASASLALGPRWPWLRRAGTQLPDRVLAVYEPAERDPPKVLQAHLLPDGGLLVRTTAGVQTLNADWTWRATLGPPGRTCTGIALKGDSFVLWRDGRGRIRTFDLDGRPAEPGRQPRTPRTHRVPSRDGRVQIVGPPGGRLVREIQEPYDDYVGARRTGADRALAWTSSGRVVLLDLGCADVPPAHVHGGDVGGAVLLRDLAVSWSEDGTLRTWDIETGDAVRIIDAHKGALRDACTDGEHVVTAGDDGFLRVWDPITGHRIAESWVDAAGIGLLRAIPDGRLVVARGAGDVSLIDPHAVEPEVQLHGHEAAVVGARPILDGSGLLTWSLDGTVRTWAWDGRPRQVLRHLGPVVGAVEIGAGHVLAWSLQAGWPGAVFWRLEDGAMLSVLRASEAARLHPGFNAPDVRQRAGWALTGGEVVTLQHANGARAVWHSEGTWQACALREDGVAVLARGREIAILHLWLGGERLGLNSPVRG